MKFKTEPIEWKPFSENALISMLEADGFINIWSGAVRSSKTVTVSLVWLDFLKNSPHSEFLMSGQSIDSLYKNVIGGKFGILNIMGSRAEYKSNGDGGAQLIINFGKGNKKTCWCRGGELANSEGKIRGMTIGGWLADEITLHHEDFVKQAINRMSLAGARAFWTTNPDSPYHFIHTDYIEKVGQIDEATGEYYDYRLFELTLEDNMALDDRYKNNLRRAYSGVWYQRMILGLWVIAEGLIYPMFTKEHIITAGAALPRFKHFYVGVDYGNTNATVFLLFGLDHDGNLYILEEFYHSAAEGAENLAPSEYAQEYIKWITKAAKKYPGMTIRSIFIDPSAKGFYLELKKAGVRNLKGANNEVVLGLGRVMNMLANKRLFIMKHCKHTIKEIRTYSWDSKAQLRGEDKPLKENDHCMDAMRYVILTIRKILKI